MATGLGALLLTIAMVLFITVEWWGTKGAVPLDR